MELQKIRERIQYTGEFSPSYEVLERLQKHFLLNVPFENLDIHLNIPLDYSPAYVYNKIVERNRGGLCYENNSLFYDILKAVGFQVHFISSEMYKGLPLKNDYNHMHMALAVHLDQNIYLVDVGNGKAFGSPIPLLHTSISKGEDGDYYVDIFQDMKALYLKNSTGMTAPRYVFNLDFKKRSDFRLACNFIETSPESVFRKGTLATLYQENERITLTGNKLVTTKNENKTINSISSKKELKATLEGIFNLYLSDAHLEQLHSQTSELSIL